MAEVAKATARSRGWLFEADERRSPLAWLTLSLRLSLGWIFLWAGADKLYYEMTTGNSATFGYLKFATYGPFAPLFQSLAGNPVIDVLLVWGLLLVGLALILGAATRVAAASGIIMMLLIYLSAWPPEHNPLVDDHIVYALLLAYLSIAGAGRFLGLGRFVERIGAIASRPRIKSLLV